MGFAVADQPVTDAAGSTGLLADELAKIKSMVTVNTPALSQAVIAGMLLACEGRISELNTRHGRVLRERDAVHPPAARPLLPGRAARALGVRWNEPDGGFFLTMRVPFRADNAALARSAEDFGVIWTPMSYFYPHGGGDHSIRLSVSYLTQDEITEGITRLASFIEAEAKRYPRPGPAESDIRIQPARTSLAAPRRKAAQMITATPCVRSKPRRWGWTYR